jgi:hypothetical protein
MSKHKYNYESEDDDYEQPDDASEDSSSEEEPEPPKKKKLSSDAKTVVKSGVKGSVKKKISDDLAFNPKLFLAVAKDLSPYEIIEDADYTLFDDPNDAPSGGGKGGYKGCQQVTMILGPKQQFGQTGTNSSGAYPLAIGDAENDYPNQTFVSGHVLNADFGGPDAAKNMTILTSSANGQQKTFDTNVKNARNALYNVYMDLASLDPIDDDFLEDIEYGIALDIQVDDAHGEWDANYPGNCISNWMDLDATVVNELRVTNAIAAPATYFNNHHRQTILNSLPNKLAAVRNLVAAANAGSPVDNQEF